MFQLNTFFLNFFNVTQNLCLEEVYIKYHFIGFEEGLNWFDGLLKRTAFSMNTQNLKAVD